MTTFSSEAVECAVCGSHEQVDVLMSTNEFGSMDLDTRPPPQARWATLRTIPRCSRCGYAAPRLQALPGSMTPGAVRELLSEGSEDSVADRWRSWSRVNEHAELFGEAGWAALRAAWAHDDEGSEADAVDCRRRAGAMFERARGSGERYSEDAASEAAVHIDVVRRAGDFERALALLEQAPGTASPVLSLVLAYQRELVLKRDAERHTLADAAGGESGSAPTSAPSSGPPLLLYPSGFLAGMSLAAWSPWSATVMLGLFLAGASLVLAVRRLAKRSS